MRILMMIILLSVVLVSNATARRSGVTVTTVTRTVSENVPGSAYERRFREKTVTATGRFIKNRTYKTIQYRK